MRKTKIICTIGPACDSEEMLRKMILGGMNVARFNFSHGSLEYFKEKIDIVKKLRKELNIPIAILLDTRGPEIRTMQVENDEVLIKEGSEFVLTTEEILGNEHRVSVTYKNLPANLTRGDTVMLDDGLLELQVTNVTKTDVVCKVIVGGVLKNRRGVNIPGVSIDMPYINEKDREDIIFGIENDVDCIALSFVRSAKDVKEVQHILNAKGAFNSIELIAKIENVEGVKNIDDIIKASHGIMVARGDMGVEIPFEELPHIQKKLIKACYTAGKKVITATQLLESMIHNPRPTRAEITDVANAIYDGTSALMMSGETTIGQYPLRSLQTMCKIAEKTESQIDYATYIDRKSILANLEVNITNAISHATCETAQDLGAAAIIAITLRGTSARMISRFRPEIPIIAVTPLEKTYMQLALSWGVTPVMNEFIENTNELILDAVDRVTKAGLIKDGDLAVITGSTQESSGATNTLQVHIIGDILLRGVGNGIDDEVSARISVIKDEEKDIAKFVPGNIIVASRTTHEILRLMRQCSGIITEEPENESGIVSAGYALGIPVISNADRATTALITGSKIRIDAKKGYIYNDT